MCHICIFVKSLVFDNLIKRVFVVFLTFFSVTVGFRPKLCRLIPCSMFDNLTPLLRMFNALIQKSLTKIINY